MAERIGIFDKVAGSPEYDSGSYSMFQEMMFTDISPDYLNKLIVSIGTGLQVVIDSGGMISKGRFYIQDEDASGGSPKTLPIDAASTGYLRKDLAVVEFDITLRTITAKISKGTEATSSPSAPSLVTGDAKWEKPLVIVNVDGNTIISVEDTRIISGARGLKEAQEDAAQAISDAAAAQEDATEALIDAAEAQENAEAAQATADDNEAYIINMQSDIEELEERYTTVQQSTSAGGTLDLSDANVVKIGDGSLRAVSVPDDASTNFPIGTRVEFCTKYNDFGFTITPLGNVQISYNGGVANVSNGRVLKISGEGGYAMMIKTYGYNWHINGDVTLN